MYRCRDFVCRVSQSSRAVDTVTRHGANTGKHPGEISVMLLVGCVRWLPSGIVNLCRREVT